MNRLVLTFIAVWSISVTASGAPFKPVFFSAEKDMKPFAELEAFSGFIPVYTLPRVPNPDLRPFKKHARYKEKYVTRVPDAERRKTPYSLSDLMKNPRSTVDSDYARSGKPFFVYEPISRPLYFIPGDGCPLADREAFAEWKKAHPGFLGFNSLWEMDSDTAYFTRFWNKIDDEDLKRELQAGFEPPHARGKGHLVSWTREAMRRLKDFHWGEARIWPLCSNDMGFEHLFAANGAAGLWYEATSQSWGAWNCASAFLRGAARQWNLKCGWYMAQYYTGHTRTGEFKHGDSKWFNRKSPGSEAGVRRYRGMGRSLHRRQVLVGWLAGADYMQTEGWQALYCDWKDGKVVPSENAIDFNEIYMLSKKVDRGEPYTPLAVLTPLAEPSSSFYKNDALLEPETQKTIFNTLVPIVSEYDGTYPPKRRKGEQGCLYNSEFPSFFDSLCPDSGQDSAAFEKALSRYRHVLIAGDAFDKGRFDSRAIAAFEKSGGKVHRYPSPGCDTPEKLRALLREIRDETMPFSVEGDVQWGVNKTRRGWLVHLVNNKGVIKFCDEPEEYDLSKTVKVTVTCKATGEKREAEIKPGDFRLMEFSGEDRTIAAARDELVKYWRLVTGDAKSIPVSLRMDPSVSKSGNDAYEIVTSNGVAVISGANARSVLYGVYDLLERRAGCGWFWDGDKVPKKDRIDVSGLNIREESKFAYRGLRYFAHRGLTRFQAEHWGLEDWKREIDWCAKKRLNLLMLRIGQDDLFQKAFPDVCAYPDASKPLPAQGRRYDNRSLFWPLEFRGELRKAVLEYAFSRGMMAPSDFGTMTHWYSRTPQDFLEKMNPDFMPQAPGAYSEPSGRVWDIRDEKWMNAYWKITDTDICEYGQPGLLHTIGIAERHVSTNKAENLAMKTKLTRAILAEAKLRYPGSARLLAGWDLYCMKKPDEVKAFLKNIPEDVIIWDYEADATINTWFGEWDIVGKRPYVFGVFMAYEAGLDSRTDYAKIAARQKLIENDPMCRGYILWPESSHVDSVGIEWFAKNSWRADKPDIAPVVADYCKRRYPDEAKTMADLWMKTIPVSTNMQNTWRWNAFLPILREMGEGLIKLDERRRWPEPKPKGFFADFSEVVAALKSLDWDKDEFLKRDMIDIARVWADRMAIDAENAMFREYFKWLDGDKSAEKRFAELADVAYARLDALASLLALHSDFSICDAYDNLAKIYPITNPGFSSVLVDNVANYYCTSHQAELARHCYLPAFRHFTELIKSKMAAGDREPVAVGVMEEFKDRAIATPISAMRLNVTRTRAEFNRALDGVLAAKELKR